LAGLSRRIVCANRTLPPPLLAACPAQLAAGRALSHASALFAAQLKIGKRRPIKRTISQALNVPPMTTNSARFPPFYAAAAEHSVANR